MNTDSIKAQSAKGKVEGPNGTDGASLEQSADLFLVTFDCPKDPDNPKDWSLARKWMVTSVLSATGFNRIMVSTIMAPALPAIAAELHISNEFESVMAMSVYLLATAFGPLVFGPLSEIYGRAPLLHATNLWFLIWNAACGFAHQKSLLITARLLAGLGAGAVYVLASGVLGDVWYPEQRGRSLGMYLLISLLGVAVGPIIGGFIVAGTTWRWIFWSTSIFQAIMTLASVPIFQETYAPLILFRKARRLRTQSGDHRYHTTNEKLVEGRSAFWVLRWSLSRPIRLLLFHHIIQIQACLSGLSYGILYLVLSSYSDLWTSTYHESVSTSGLHYISVCVGEVIGAQIGGFLMDHIFARLKARANGITKPEHHVPVMIPASLVTLLGLLLYGWGAQRRRSWLMVDFGVAIFTCGQQITGQALQAYVIDATPEYASSASASSQLFRSLCAFGFPLFAPAMHSALGYGWANTVLGLVVLTSTIPATIAILLYGDKLRVKGEGRL